MALALAALAAGGAGCGAGETSPPPPGPWTRIDLWSRPPRVEVAAGPGEPYAAATATLGTAGATAGAPAAGAPAAGAPAAGTPPAGRVRAVAQRSGSRLAWTIDVPPVEPYLAVTPLGAAGGDCRCVLRAGVRDADGIVHELFRTRAATSPRLAPAAAEIDLSAFAATRVEVLFQVDPAPGAPPAAQPGEPARAWWASPAVYGRLERAAAAEPARQGDGEAPLDVLLVAVESLRADAVGPRRPGRSLTPALDRLAAEGDSWDAAFATSSAAGPALASILTGLRPADHGVRDRASPLPPEQVTLGDRFGRAGWATYAALAARDLGADSLGLARGFGEVAASEADDAGELVVDRALEWLEGRGGPWFAFLHFFDPHPPHAPPQPYGLGFRPAAASGLGPVAAWLPFRQPGALEWSDPGLGAHPDLYDGEIAYLDRQLGRLLGFLEGRGLLEDTVVAVAGAYGEELGEHGPPFSARGLHDPVVRVPLIVRWPERLLEGPDWLHRRGRRFGGLVQTLDLAPTLLAAAGLRPPPGPGEDLRELTPEPDGPDGPRVPGRPHVHAEHRGGAMVRTDRWKYIRTGAGPELYDLRTDPQEAANLAGRGLEVEPRLAALLERR